MESVFSEVDVNAFVQAPEHRPKVKVNEAEGIPLIDLSRANEDELAREIGDACREWGFFQVVNHGVAAETRQRMEAAVREFFAMEMEEKRRVKRDELRLMGYYDEENIHNVRDWKEVFDFLAVDPSLLPASMEPGNCEVQKLTNQWPEGHAEMRAVLEEYSEEIQKLSFKLLELIAVSLGLSANRFTGFFRDQTSILRLNHYPPCPIPGLALGVGPHTDSGALTVLAQDNVGGLEVRRKTDREWVRVKPTPDAYIVNVADIMQVWSNDMYESVEHRVMVNSEKARLSLAFFFKPSHYTMVEPLEELTSANSPAKFCAYNWGQFFLGRANDNYKKSDEDDIEIDNFRTLN